MVKKLWLYKPPKKSAAKVPDLTKATISGKAATLIDEILKPQYVRERDPSHDYNYMVDIFGNWHGRYFYFCSRYNCPSPKAIAPSFNAKFARMECVGDDSFNLSYMRHTGQWVEVFQGLSLDQCFEEIANNPIFEP